MLIGIIEDDRLLNESLKIALNSAGYKTICAHTKAEALACLGTAEDLLLIDIGLPDGDGISLYRELCERRRVPAVFLTARDEERDMLAAFEEGAEDYVVKPFSVKVLIKRVEAVLRRSRGDKLLGSDAYSEGILPSGVSDDEPGAGGDEREYPGKCLGRGRRVCGGQHGQRDYKPPPKETGFERTGFRLYP